MHAAESQDMLPTPLTYTPLTRVFAIARVPAKYTCIPQKQSKLSE